MTTVWLSMACYYGWPLILVPISYLFLRNSVGRKWLYMVLGLVVCFAISFVIEYAAFYYLLGMAGDFLKNISDQAMKWVLPGISGVKVLVSICMLLIMSKMNFLKKHH